jgi:hypothetical protein
MIASNISDAKPWRGKTSADTIEDDTDSLDHLMPGDASDFRI